MDTVTYQSYPLGQGALPPAIELARRLVDNRCHQESYQEAARARQRHLYAAACGDTPQSFTARFLSSLTHTERIRALRALVDSLRTRQHKDADSRFDYRLALLHLTRVESHDTDRSDDREFASLLRTCSPHASSLRHHHRHHHTTTAQASTSNSTVAEASSTTAKASAISNATVAEASSASSTSSLWQDFEVDTYAAPPPRRRPEAVVSVSDTSMDSLAPRTTESIPFRLSKRPRAPPSRSLIEYLDERDQRQRDEDAHLRYRFRARKVPHHTHYPLFEWRCQRSLDRSQEVRESSERLTRANEAPFRLTHTQNRPPHCPPPREPNRTFIAHPVPASTYVAEHPPPPISSESEPDRAARLLRESALPRNMQDDVMSVGALRRQVLAQRQQRAHLTPEHSFQPDIGYTPDVHELPDFARMHARLDARVDSARQHARDAATTQPKPFRLRGDAIPSRKDRICEELERDEQRLLETRWPYASPRRAPLSSSPAASPSNAHVELNRTVILREQRLRAKQETQRLTERMEHELHLDGKRRSKDVRAHVTAKLRQRDDRLRSQQKEQHTRAHHLAAQIQRNEELYHNGLAEMEGRLERRPVLFERSSPHGDREAGSMRVRDLSSTDSDSETDDDGDYVVTHANNVVMPSRHTRRPRNWTDMH